ncbi:hypothetical protein ARMSODRAFT_982990 [Armillaria solidipes]|uniref:Uncharacterized protein n=1 Tax=Armillaria solidipes TaxID=1076256 RepID=A0A2H3AKV7_9AGAR|nr:hypothetical protein ARMSODRAFT_982990 [Armillaria solidipes]
MRSNSNQPLMHIYLKTEESRNHLHSPNKFIARHAGKKKYESVELYGGTSTMIKHQAESCYGEQACRTDKGRWRSLRQGQAWHLVSTENRRHRTGRSSPMKIYCSAQSHILGPLPSTFVATSTLYTEPATSNSKPLGNYNLGKTSFGTGAYKDERKRGAKGGKVIAAVVVKVDGSTSPICRSVVSISAELSKTTNNVPELLHSIYSLWSQYSWCLKYWWWWILPESWPGHAGRSGDAVQRRGQYKQQPTAVLPRYLFFPPFLAVLRSSPYILHLKTLYGCLNGQNMKLLSATQLRNTLHAARAALMRRLNIITAAMRRSVHRGHTESSSAADSPPPSTPDMFSWEERQHLFSVRSAADLNIEETPEFGEFHSDV